MLSKNEKASKCIVSYRKPWVTSEYIRACALESTSNTSSDPVPVTKHTWVIVSLLLYQSESSNGLAHPWRLLKCSSNAKTCNVRWDTIKTQKIWMKNKVLYLLRRTKNQKAFSLIKRKQDISANTALIDQFFANIVGERIVDIGKDIEVNTNLLPLVDHKQYVICCKELWMSKIYRYQWSIYERSLDAYMIRRSGGSVNETERLSLTVGVGMNKGSSWRAWWCSVWISSLLIVYWNVELICVCCRAETS